ncbi:heme exporter protein C [Natronocella acetinitrilica]|uniref:Heme exporter protein C n=2 Tax=Natronocella acetinitrilica TaxID=414046 RepID=A0AAE3G691_9GAMM|nr:heme exporter protein C [Natronocella acetinitrilica]
MAGTHSQIDMQPSISAVDGTNPRRRSRWVWFHRLGSPPTFYALAGRLIPWFTAIFLILTGVGLYLGFFVAPPDYQQGEAYRILYVHAPSAWMSMFIYVVMAVCGAIVLIWRMKLAEIIAVASAPIGAGFTFLCLATGSLWGKPMWGTFWVWDARLTSQLILLFLYFGFMALYAAIEDRRTAARAASLIAVVGVINVPIIHFSVKWWNTLHQGPTVTKLDAPSIDLSMLIPLLIMVLAFQFYYAAAVLVRARHEVLTRERNTSWVRALFGGQQA